LLWWTQPGQRSEPSLVTVIRAENDTWHRWIILLDAPIWIFMVLTW
jgi:hypothetical protein